MKTNRAMNQLPLFAAENAAYAERETCQSSTPFTAREKLERYGVEGLSDTELLTLMLPSDHPSIAAEILDIIDTIAPETLYDSLRSIREIGSNRAASLSAAFELVRRRLQAHSSKVRGPEDVVRLLSYLNHKEQEHFISISLNGAHEVKQVRVLTVGLINVCQIHPREVFSHAIHDRAVSLIVAHNHPSGDTTPSKEDIRLTERLGDAADLIGIPLLDHIIFGHRGFLSFKSQGLALRSS
jgi:DNA repair protein RadC